MKQKGDLKSGRLFVCIKLGKPLRMNVSHGVWFVPLVLLFDPFVRFKVDGHIFDGCFEDVDVVEIGDADAELIGVVEKAQL